MGYRDLPWLSGPQDQLGQVLKNWTKFNDELVSSGLEIQQMTLDRRGAWSMVLNNGTSVHLGRDAAWEQASAPDERLGCVAAGPDGATA